MTRRPRLHKWEARTEFSIEYLPALIVMFWRSIFSVRPQVPNSGYYRALLRAALSLLLDRRIRSPIEFLPPRSVVAYEEHLYLLTPDVLYGYYLLPFEPATRKTLLGATGRVFVDVGANVGQYSIPLARRFERCIAVEPHPVACRILRENLELNAITNVQIVQKAVSLEGGKVPLFRGTFLSTWSTAVKATQSIQVETCSLNELITPFDRVDLMKIDIEGAEVPLIYGSAQALEKVEVLDFETSLEEDTSPLFRWLEAAGFKVTILGGWLRDRENTHAIRVRPSPSVREPKVSNPEPVS